MTANELRVGNWVEKDGEIYQASSASIVLLERGEATINPIPLTEEWLLRLGFGQNVPKNAWWNEIEFLIGQDVSRFYLAKFGGTSENPIIEDAIPVLDSINITTVHQLQNLYFALTGQELTIKQ